jgi:hypothetical protein
MRKGAPGSGKRRNSSLNAKFGARILGAFRQ